MSMNSLVALSLLTWTIFTEVESGSLNSRINVSAGVLASSEIFDSSVNQWKATGSMATPREYHTATLLNSDKCVCLAGCSSAYSNTALPSSSFSGATAFGYWDDLYIYSGTSQSVYYGTTGTYPNRNLVFEFYTAHFSQPTLYYHFQIVFYEASPNIVRYLYYQASDGGTSATIGVQSTGSGPSMTYSVNAASVPAGSSTTSTATLTLTFNTGTGTYTSSG
ncbi:unnamed protein product [Rotaria magnacalcarata]|uniref:Uncharacterized protein n=1 Tax=Rotaria magnacalcarata TaxID=392030 RepID=A0A816KVG6_9BILA|nr:unnamed protein product [Rotaria magnacalcarata]